MIRRIVMLSLVIAVGALNVRAQLSSLEIKPTVDENGLTGPITVRVRVTNKDPNSYIDIIRATLQLPSALVVGGRPRAVDIVVNRDLDPNESVEFPLQVPGIKWYHAFRPVFFQWRRSEGTLTLRTVTQGPDVPATHGAVDTNQPLPGDGREQDFSTTVEITPAPSLPLITFGGIVGVLLLMLLYALLPQKLRIARHHRLRQFGVGVVAVVIFCILSKVSQQNVVPLPVTLDVRDFYGGIVLGLFSDAIISEFLRVVGKRRSG